MTVEAETDAPVCQQDGQEQAAARARETLGDMLEVAASGSMLCAACIGEVFLFYAIAYARVAGEISPEEFIEHARNLLETIDVPLGPAYPHNPYTGHDAPS